MIFQIINSIDGIQEVIELFCRVQNIDSPDIIQVDEHTIDIPNQYLVIIKLTNPETYQQFIRMMKNF